MAKTSDLVRYLNSNRIPFQLVRHLPAFKALDVAQATHVPDKEMAKTLLVKAGQVYWMAVMRADRRMDERLLKKALAVHHVHLAHEDDLNQLFPDCEIGAMPPFGNLYGFPVVVDASLAEDEEIIFNACTHTESIRMKFADYERLVKPLLAQFVTSEEHVRETESS